MYSVTHFHTIIVEFQWMFVNMMYKADGLSECDREKEEDGRGECGRRGLHLGRRPLRGLAPAGRDSRFNQIISYNKKTNISHPQRLIYRMPCQRRTK